MNVTATHCAYEKVFELQTALLEQKSIISGRWCKVGVDMTFGIGWFGDVF